MSLFSGIPEVGQLAAGFDQRLKSMDTKLDQIGELAAIREELGAVRMLLQSILGQLLRGEE